MVVRVFLLRGTAASVYLKSFKILQVYHSVRDVSVGKVVEQWLEKPDTYDDWLTTKIELLVRHE